MKHLPTSLLQKQANSLFQPQLNHQKPPCHFEEAFHIFLLTTSLYLYHLFYNSVILHFFLQILNPLFLCLVVDRLYAQVRFYMFILHLISQDKSVSTVEAFHLADLFVGIISLTLTVHVLAEDKLNQPTKCEIKNCFFYTKY